jgi:hypothetical protein
LKQVCIKMGFFGLNDPATENLGKDPVLAELAGAGDEATVALRAGKKKAIKRCNSLDYEPTSPSLLTGRSTRKARTPVRRVRSNVSSSMSSGMQEHLEDIEAFCQVMKEAGSEQREKLLRKSLRRQSTGTKS